ncbi:hypothetical protein WUBG_07179 [Wuchereria bancrofti]|uniref:Uncharacterized protein n=1 Tax=Wuchereria bancrofti TaxID=6293 RepID=J9EHF1_WUCBA|nr:hypothetical protein WUBG_07179 [Wuchereria bancrofti]
MPVFHTKTIEGILEPVAQQLVTEPNALGKLPKVAFRPLLFLFRKKINSRQTFEAFLENKLHFPIASKVVVANYDLGVFRNVDIAIRTPYSRTLFSNYVGYKRWKWKNKRIPGLDCITKHQNV